MSARQMILMVSLAAQVLLAEGAEAQRKWSYARAKAEFRDTRKKSNDLVVLQHYLERAVSEIPAKEWKHRNLSVFMRIQLADVYYRTGNFADAERLYLSAIDLVRGKEFTWKKARLPFLDGTVFKAFDKLGYFYLNTGSFRKARQLFVESASLRESVFPDKSVFHVAPLVGLGSLHYRQAEYDSARAVFSQSARMLRRATTTLYDYDQVGRLFLNDLAEICLRMGTYREAWDYIEQLSASSSGITKFRSKPESRLETARIFEMKARFFLLNGDYERSQDYLNRANKYNTLHFAGSDVTFKLLKTQAMLFWLQEDVARADQFFLALSNTYRDHIRKNFIAMSEYEKEQFYQTLKNDFNLFNAYAVSRQSPVLFEEIYNNTLYTKALLLNETNKLKNNIVRNGNEDLVHKFRQWEKARAQLSALYYDQKRGDDVDSLANTIESLEKEINLESGLFKDADDLQVWQKVRGCLRPGEAAIEIIRVNMRERDGIYSVGENAVKDSVVYLALIIKEDIETPEFVYLSNGQQLEERLLAFYRNCIFGRITDNRSYEQFWEPIKKRLTGIRRIYFSPDGVFNQINLNTLLNPVSGQYVLDETELMYVTNTADLLKKNGEARPDTKAVLFGSPLFDAEAETDLARNPAFVYGTRNVLTDDLARFTEQNFTALPGTEVEINRIRETLREKNVAVKTFMGADAREEYVKAIERPLILHIATHGFFVDDAASGVNPMIRSGLVLAGVNNNDYGVNDDGILTAYEATNLDLEGTSLVTLSACETGVGEVRNGQGVYGLQRAIIVAGAGNLLMSLWKVDDEATASLMVEFYKEWNQNQNQNQAAFTKAQIQLRKKFSHPFYWGAFIMLGP